MSPNEQSMRSARMADVRWAYRLSPVIIVLAAFLSGCGDKQAPQAAAPPAPPVTVAQPVKRTVTDWDEFTGRFDAVEQVQVRARASSNPLKMLFSPPGWAKARPMKVR